MRALIALVPFMRFSPLVVVPSPFEVISAGPDRVMILPLSVIL